MFDPINFFKLAQHMVEGSEAEIRTSISRAYYASFLIVRDKLGLKVSIPEVHRESVKKLYEKSPPLANNLHNLRRLRNISDYNMKIKVNPKYGKTALKLASYIIGKVGENKKKQLLKMPLYLIEGAFKPLSCLVSS